MGAAELKIRFVVAEFEIIVGHLMYTCLRAAAYKGRKLRKEVQPILGSQLHTADFFLQQCQIRWKSPPGDLNEISHVTGEAIA